MTKNLNIIYTSQVFLAPLGEIFVYYQ